MVQLAQRPNQPTSLPPSFITAFVHRAFPSDLVQVDFPQALTALDYLKDLENRRRREVAAAMRRLNIDRQTLDSNSTEMADTPHHVLQWVQSMEGKERKIDSLYTQIYVGLRRWILINELSLLPFNKHNCVAMLNTLYPPVMASQPTNKLTYQVLKTQREGFFKYIQSVEKSGEKVLHNLIHQGEAPQDLNGWAAVTRALGLYLQVANSVISECMVLTAPEDLAPRKNAESPTPSRHNRKADSGVSFGSSDHRPSTGGSNSDTVSPTDAARPWTPSTARPGTALEKLARGLKVIGRSKTNATEMLRDDAMTPPPQPTEKPKTLRKMKSMGSIEVQNISKANLHERQNSERPYQTFESEAMRRRRLRYEAQVAAQEKFGKRPSQPWI